MQRVDLEEVQQRAESGEARAQLELAQLKLAEDNYDDAVDWLRKAAEQDNSDAQLLYGSLLSEGRGIDQDFEAAAYWLSRAAEQGNSGAQLLLAQSFESGSGVPVNHAMAAKWYLRAAEAGDVVAQYRIGDLLRTGSGVEKNLDEADRWLRKAAESGNTDAQVALCECWIEQEDYSMRDLLRFSQMAAEKGSAKGAYILGWAYENSQAGVRDPDGIARWYREAAKNGNAEAQVRLATLYAEGKVVPNNQQEAEGWLKMVVASEQQAAASASSAPEVAKPAAPVVSASFVAIKEYPPGSIIENKYFIMSMVGKGGMCMVYKAKHLLLNKMVALKMLLPESLGNKTVVDRFVREARSACSLTHPNIITVSDVSTSADGIPYMVMEFIEGTSLEERVDSVGRLTPQQVVSIFLQVCAGLDTAHEANIIHRDIKPSNIMLLNTKLQQDVVKVVDFGLAKSMNADEQDQKLTKTGEVFGTLLYMSPEQCLGHPLDVRTDIYSVGCSMYECLTGTPVHRGSNAYELMSKHINTPAPAFATVASDLQCPPELEQIVLKALNKNRDERHQSMAQLHQELSALRF